MEPSVVALLLGAALAALVALGQRRASAEPEPLPVRVDDDPATRRS